MKLIIKRSEWLRGEGNDASRLLRQSDNKMCCLGFLSVEIGLSKDEIMNAYSPCKIANWPNPDKFFLKGSYDIGNNRYYDTDFGNQLMKVNDSKDISEKEREEKLFNLFAQVDIQVEFID